MKRKRIDWVNTTFIAATHALAVVAIVHLAAVHFSWWTLGLGLLWSVLTGLSITGGYHRLFSHRAYRATAPVRAFYLLFGAGAFQNSALKWSVDHRVHHRHTDGEKDPYNIGKGFWWAHIGWILCRPEEQTDLQGAKDLWNDPLVRFQHRFYLPLAVFSGLVLPGLVGLAWGDPVGAVLVAGFLRLALVWNATFSINSFAHLIGTRHYSLANSARDSIVTAFLSLGEGYHNFHHRFQSDYRNGIRWYHWDPTKWWLWTLAKVRLVADLKRVPREAIEAAKAAVRAERLAAAGV